MSTKESPESISARIEPEILKHFVLKWKRFVGKSLSAEDRSIVSREVSKMFKTLDDASPSMPSTQYRYTHDQIHHASTDVGDSMMTGDTIGSSTSNSRYRLTSVQLDQSSNSIYDHGMTDDLADQSVELRD